MIFRISNRSACYCLLIYFRSSHRKCSIKKGFFNISQNSQENTGFGVSFEIKLQDSGRQLYRTSPVAAFVIYNKGIFLFIIILLSILVQCVHACVRLTSLLLFPSRWNRSWDISYEIKLIKLILQIECPSPATT